MSPHLAKLKLILLACRAVFQACIIFIISCRASATNFAKPVLIASIVNNPVSNRCTPVITLPISDKVLLAFFCYPLNALVEAVGFFAAFSVSSRAFSSFSFLLIVLSASALKSPESKPT
ncbi:hypothetical protein [Acinetobacter calcoaceticus]|uniref:hypothetical protein n=1 Tax=Acinetobacter calcoaceticus TaxID=471 RepID=UPI00248F4855|nr:hypothetical protein [Acinetobacter calcoaceticus]